MARVKLENLFLFLGLILIVTGAIIFIGEHYLLGIAILVIGVLCCIPFLKVYKGRKKK